MPTRWLQHKLDMHPSILSENTKTGNGDRSVKTQERLEEFQRKGKRKKYIPKTYIHRCPSEELLAKWQSEVSQGNYKGIESRWVWKYAKQGRPANKGTPLFGTQCFPHLLYQTISDSSVETLGYSNSTPTERYKVDFKQQVFSASVPWERTSHLRTSSPKFLILREEKKTIQNKIPQESS